ncbi:hypothetical protein H6P81_011521 [Aristolochia fimbriata]|uniref:Methyltransferase type 11 domain-containing protein n=1 Tax=Aristolochia fimbriata TaxID=158543 RepID=A0AAV7EUP2_ARIFI|nr:hypothetical protein H6P81_011521 [Aristolochia fimbriata]
MAACLSYVGVPFPSSSRVSTLPSPGKQRLTVRCFSSPRVRASATVSVEATPELDSDDKVSFNNNFLACPICYDPLIKNAERESTAFQCPTCKKCYSKNEVFHDLTIAGGAKTYGEVKPLSTEVFRLSLVSFLYERGWRQSFIWGGFPGPDKEFEMAQTYLESTRGGILVDASCGSGLFTRRFVKSEIYSRVIAMDFSENMLRQCYEFVEQDALPKENLTLVRADISRLPFASSSIDAVHAGAALHCWPSPSTAVAEICRVLRPGGVFVATTFVLDGIPALPPVLKASRQYFAQVSSNHYFFTNELEDLFKACGLVGFQSVRNGSFIMMSANKPS